MTVHITGGTHQVAMAGEHLSPTQEIPLSLRFVLKRPRNYQHANSEHFQKMLEAPSAPEIKVELHNILFNPKKQEGKRIVWRLRGPVMATLVFSAKTSSASLALVEGQFLPGGWGQRATGTLLGRSQHCFL